MTAIHKPACRLGPLLLVAVGLASCASRPTAAVLDPMHPANLPAKRITLLAATNRAGLGPSKVYQNNWAQTVTYESYEMSVPPSHKESEIEYPAARPDPLKQFVVTRRQALPEAGFVAAAARSVGDDGSVGLYVHGYNNSYQEALYREAQVATDSGLSGTMMFSWPSQASLVGYVADRDAALYSRRDLETVVIALASSPKIKRIVLFGHSMGGFLVMEVVRQLKLEHRDDVIKKLDVMLASPDIDVDVFRAQLKDIGELPVPLTLFVSKVDRALAVSGFIGGERPRVGQLDINDPSIQEAARKSHVRIVDLSSLNATDGVGHDRFATLARFGSQLARIDKTPAAATSRVGAFVFDAAGVAVSTPFRLASQVVAPR